jgi:hypothetical protein
MMTGFRCRLPAPAQGPIARDLGMTLLLLLAVRAQAQSYEHVTITASTLVSSFASLGQCIHDDLGLSDTTVTTEYIYSHYPGRDNPEKIRNFIRYAYQNWGTTHILLGGDVDKVPCRYAFVIITTRVPPESTFMPCDLYYSDLDGDWDRDGDGLFGELEDSCDMYPDVHVGRVGASDAGTAGNFVQHFLTYVHNPNAPYLRRNLLSGFDVYDVPEVHCEKVMEFYDTTYVPEHLRPSVKVYDSDIGDHRRAIINALRAGVNLWIHADHGLETHICTGYLRHYWLIEQETLANLNSGDYLTILTSAACYIANFEHSDCLGENYTTSSNGGAVAVIGNCRTGKLQNPDPYRGATFFMIEGLVRRLFGHGGDGSLEDLALARAEAAPLIDTNTTLRWADLEYNLLGEAAMPVWIPDPTAMADRRDALAPVTPAATVVRGVLEISLQLTAHRSRPGDGLYDANGRRVLDLKPGANDVSPLAPGVYFLRSGLDPRPHRVTILR